MILFNILNIFFKNCLSACITFKHNSCCSHSRASWIGAVIVRLLSRTVYDLMYLGFKCITSEIILADSILMSKA